MINRFLFLLVFSYSATSLSMECKEADWNRVKELQKGNGPTDVVFFASWCSSCKEHLKTEYKTNVIFISLFDEKNDSERVLKHFKPNATCYFSDDIEKELKIKSLPKTIQVTF